MSDPLTASEFAAGIITLVVVVVYFGIVMCVCATRIIAAIDNLESRKDEHDEKD